MFGLSFEMSVILIICLLAAFAFEFINGFHDTANAVATVIYTKSLKPSWAVIWSGIWNCIGVYVGGIAVAMGIVNLLSNTVLIDTNVYHAIAMILALIITAIMWNLWTWYFGIPCSSSHTLIGSIFGVGVAFMLLPDNGAVALNWGKVKDVGLSLFLSPAIGFGLAIGCMALFKKFITKKSFYEIDPKKKHPPFGTRITLIATSTLLSFFHGSNDGQKGVGLVMIILIAFIPTKFALDPHKSSAFLSDRAYQMENIVKKIDTAGVSFEGKLRCQLLEEKLIQIHVSVDDTTCSDSIKGGISLVVRKDILTVSNEVNSLLEASIDKEVVKISDEDKDTLRNGSAYMKSYIEYSPWWVVLFISISLGLGTMIGWRRIVVTIGEKIGKTPLSYAQGASANLVAALTIGLSTSFGLPVSTTHVLSSGIAGTMVAKKGVKNLRMGTVRNIIIAWLITLPVTIVMAGALFLLLRWLIG
jgi:phosphate/sulfate permease